MASEKKFIMKALIDYDVAAFLEKQLEKAGVSSVTIQKTPIATRILIDVRKPGMVVGKKGASIKELNDLLTNNYGIENPQIEVSEVAVPSLDAKLMAEKVGKTIEIKGNPKQAIRMGLKEIMSAGALGAEVICGGKIVGKGGKAKVIKVRDGYLKKSGHSMKLVKKAKYTAYTKAGAIGVVVKILHPGVIFEDQIKIESILAKQASNEVKDAAKAEADALKASEPKTEGKTEEKPVEKKKMIRKPPVRKKKTEEKPVEKKAEEKPAEKKAEEKAVEKPVEKTQLSN